MSLAKMLKPAGNTIPFRLLKKGRGGLLYFNHNPRTAAPMVGGDPISTHQVGVYGVTDTTGVYFALNEQCCFTAHINSWVYDRTASSIHYKVSKLEGLDLRSQITTRLHATMGAMGFNIANTCVTRPYAQRSLIIISPNMNHPDGAEQVGLYVAKGVRDYLGLKDESHAVDVKHSGFVLQHLQRPYLVSLAGAQNADGRNPSELGLFCETEEEGDHISDWTSGWSRSRIGRGTRRIWAARRDDVVRLWHSRKVRGSLNIQCYS